MRSSLIVLLGLSLFAGPSAFGQNCKLQNPNQVLEHIKKYHPEVVAENHKNEVYKKAIQKSAQRPNPRIEMSAKTPSGHLGDEGSIIGGEFKHVFELGGKRQARIELSESKLREQKIKAQKTKESALISTAKTLNKLAQINKHEALYDESIQSFQKLLKTVKKLPSKSPKEVVETSTLEIVIQDYQIKKSRLQGMKERLHSHLKFFVKDRCELSPGLFQKEAHLRPLPERLSQQVTQGVDYQLSQEETKTQKQRLELEKSKAWSNLELGPAIEYTDKSFSDMGRELKVGLAIEFSLPLFHTNTGGKAEALKGVKEKNFRLQAKKKKLSLELKRRIKNYQTYKTQLKTLDNHNEVQQKHKKIESLFSRGVIPTNLIIEIHRQLTNWHHDKHHFQRLAIDSLWRIYELTGKVESAKY